MKRTALVSGLAGLVLITAGCGSQKYNEQYRDAHVQSRDDSPADVYTMPDGFSNFAEKCDGRGHRVFVLFHEDSAYGGIAVINDPKCGG